MTNEPFTASNGDTIETRPDGYLVVKDGHHTEWVSPLTVDALREYLQHQRDTEQSVDAARADFDSIDVDQLADVILAANLFGDGTAMDVALAVKNWLTGNN